MEKMAIGKHRSVLWVDNQISEMFGSLVAEMRHRGHEICAVDNGADAIKAIGEIRFDLAFIDLLMPGVKGAEVIKQLSLLQPRAKAATVTSYRTVQGLAVSDSLIAEIEKPELLSIIDNPSDAYEFMFEEIERQSHSKVKAHKRSDVVKVTIDQYRNMPIEDRHALLQVAKVELKEEIQEAFENGATWVLFCGSRDAVTKSFALDELPTGAELVKIGDDFGFAPLLFVGPMQIDDLAWSESCSAALRGYPTITFKVGDKEETCHFDTGSPTSWVKLEWFDSAFPEKQISLGALNVIDINGHEVAVIRETVHTVFVDQDRGYLTEGKIGFFVVIEWSNCPLRRDCRNPCRRDLEDCEYRFALIGRDIRSTDPIILNLATRSTTIDQNNNESTIPRN